MAKVHRVRPNRLIAANEYTLFKPFRDKRGRLQVEVIQGDIRQVKPPCASPQPCDDSEEKPCPEKRDTVN